MVLKLVLLLGSLIWKRKKEVVFGSDKDIEIRYPCFELKSCVFSISKDIEGYLYVKQFC